MATEYRKLASIEADRDVWYAATPEQEIVILKGARRGVSEDALQHEFAALVDTHEAVKRRTGLPRSPFVVKEHGLIELDGKKYLVLEDAGDRCIRDLVPDRRAIFNALGDVADGLAHIHFADRRHYDLKSSNILLDQNDRIKLIDLSLCAFRCQNSFKTNHGTPGYASPESLNGEGDARADTFSLGATAFELLTGRLLYGSGSNYLRDVKAGLHGAFRPWPVIPGLSKSTFDVIRASTAFRSAGSPSLKELGDAFRTAAVECVQPRRYSS